MSNIVEFAVRMKDMMSNGLSRLGSRTRSTFNTMAQHVDRVSGRNRVLSQSFEAIQRNIRNVENTIRTSTIPSQIAAARRELASLQRQAARHPGNLGGGGSGSGGSGGGFSVGKSAIGNLLGNLATNAASAFLNVVKDGIGAAITGAMEKEKDLVGLSTFIGDKGAKEAYANIRQDAQVTPYDTASLLKVNRALISSGLSAKDAREDTMNLANAISATGGGNDELMRMAMNMQQIKSLGKASAMDIKQFGYAGINIYEMLHRSTGKSVDDLKKMDITYDELAKSMAIARSKGGLYDGALEKMGNTMSGKWESVKDRSANALTDIGDAFSPIIVKVLNLAIKMSEQVTPLLASAQPYIEMLSTGLGNAIDYVLSIANGTGMWGDYLDILVEYYGVLWRVVKGLFTSIGKIITGMVDWATKSELMRDIFHGMQFIMISILEVVGWLGEKLAWVWEKVLKPFLANLELAYRTIKDIIGLSDADLKVQVDKTTKQMVVVPKAPVLPNKPYAADLTRFKNMKTSGGDDDKEKNKKKSKEKSDVIGGGGTKYITINLGKFFETIQFTTMNTQESSQELEKLLLECMGRVLFNGGKNM